MRAPCGSQNAEPGDSSWKKKSSWSCLSQPSEGVIEVLHGDVAPHSADFAMIAFGSLLQKLLVLHHSLLVGERDTINALQ